jgi:hypothetical protein
VARLTAAEEARRAAAEGEARRVAAEVLQRRQAQLRQLDESRRIAAIEAFVVRAAVALNEWAGLAQLRRAALTIGVAAAASLLEQTLLLEAAGGLLKKDGSGERRTAGGVFLGVLLRDNISKEAYKHIQAARPRTKARLACSAAYIRGVPPTVPREEVGQLLRDHFGELHEKGEYRLKLHAAPDGLLCGKVYFRKRSSRRAAVMRGGVRVMARAETALSDFITAPGPSVQTSVQTEGRESGAWQLSVQSEGRESGAWLLMVEDGPTAGVHYKQAPAQCAEEEPWCSAAVCEQLALAGEAEEEEEDAQEWCPDDFICPITLERLVEPVTAADGLTYERAALQGWIDKHAADQVVLSPATGAPLAHRELVTNVEILEKLTSVGRLASWLE